MSDEGMGTGCPWPFQVAGRIYNKEGYYMTVTINGDRDDNIIIVMKWMVDNGIKPIIPPTPMPMPTGGGGGVAVGEAVKPVKPGPCPKCGGERWAWDKHEGRGWYCTVKVPQGYCGFQAWKGDI